MEQTEHPFNKFYELVKANAGIYGEQWDITLRIAAYKFASMLLPRQPIKIRGYVFDSRINHVIDAPSSSGTNLIKNMEKKLCEQLSQKGIIKTEAFISTAPTHPEQNIGTVIQDKKGQYKPIIGDFLYHNIFWDDADTLFTAISDKFVEFRDRMNSALDPIGRSPIRKRPTGVPAEHALYFIPDCNMTFRIHTDIHKIPEKHIASGLAKRLLWTKIITPIGYEERVAENKMFQANTGDISEVTDFLINRVNRSNIYILLEKDTNRALSDIKKIQGSLRATNMAGYTYFKDVIPETYLKLAGILAKCRGEETINENDFLIAAQDTEMFIKGSLEFLKTAVLGLRVKGLEQDIPITNSMLDTLKKAQCISKEASTITIQTLLNNTCKAIFNKEFNMKRETNEDKRIYYSYNYLKEQRKIDSCQDGQHGSKVWLLNP